MKYRKTMPILEDNRKATNKRNGNDSRRITIPLEIRKFIEVKKGDYIEWEVDTMKKTLVGKLIKKDETVKMNSFKIKPYKKDKLKKPIKIKLMKGGRT